MSSLWIVPSLALALFLIGFEPHQAVLLAGLVAFGYWHGHRGTLDRP